MKISAFIPVTNAIKRGDTFLEAIRSHLFWADELVVVDGGSTDGTVEAIRALKDPRIKIITRPWPQDDWSWTEFAKAWNAGLDAATGDWVAAGESDHVFRECDVKRLTNEIDRETLKGRAVIKIQKIQSADYLHWHSKSQMYYFINKAKFPKIRYGFDPKNRTDLAHPIWWEGEMYEDIPTGTAIIEGDRYEGLIGGTGVNLFNYLWTFKTVGMICQERLKANHAWNKFSGFTHVYMHRKTEDPDQIKAEILTQILSVRQKATKFIPLDLQPKLIGDRLRDTDQLLDNMIGSPTWDLKKC